MLFVKGPLRESEIQGQELGSGLCQLCANLHEQRKRSLGQCQGVRVLRPLSPADITLQSDDLLCLLWAQHFQCHFLAYQCDLMPLAVSTAASLNRRGDLLDLALNLGGGGLGSGTS